MRPRSLSLPNRFSMWWRFAIAQFGMRDFDFPVLFRLDTGGNFPVRKRIAQPVGIRSPVGQRLRFTSVQDITEERLFDQAGRRPVRFEGGAPIMISSVSLPTFASAPKLRPNRPSHSSGGSGGRLSRAARSLRAHPARSAGCECQRQSGSEPARHRPAAGHATAETTAISAHLGLGHQERPDPASTPMAAPGESVKTKSGKVNWRAGG